MTSSHRGSPLGRALLALLAALGLAAGTAALPASAAPPQPGWYYALGDSFAAGVGGDDPVLDGTTCGRTYDAYPVLLGAKKNIACASATTADVLKQARTIPPHTGLISVTVGGNDVGALQATSICLNNPGTPSSPGSATCDQAIATSEALIPALEGRISLVVAAIRRVTPEATIVLTGYPHLFTPAGLPEPYQTVTTQLNAGADLLNGALEGYAAENGVAFVSVAGAFDGHGWGSVDPWINSPFGPGALHPNDSGYLEGYAHLVGPALGLPVPAVAG